MKKQTIFCFVLLLCVTSCASKQEKPEEIEPKDLYHSYPAFNPDSSINAIVEIPAGTNQKWQVSKSTGQLEWEQENGKNRVVNYLPYPGNYGMIPQTLLPKEEGGDGDPLDVLLLGPALPAGVPVRIKLIGLLRLRDRGEVDDKLIGVFDDSPMADLGSIDSLNSRYPGAAMIVETWFSNYKGPGKIESLGYQGTEEAMQMLKKAALSYQKAFFDTESMD
ncbi:MAG: inorganic diphosphatase [Bacteroidia bacterium]